MGKNTAIAWTDHTFNAWWGCRRVSPGCEHCYAEAFAARWGHHCWAGNPRRFFGAKHWKEPIAWNEAATAEDTRRRVFAGSMCDVMELGTPEDQALEAARRSLFDLIGQTPMLDWLLVTKRPENYARLLPAKWLNPGAFPQNVWLLASAVNQAELVAACVALAPFASLAPVRGISAEPLLGPLMFDCLPAGAPPPNWLILGGESGPGARPCSPSWMLEAMQSYRRVCRGAVFVKQLGAVWARQAARDAKAQVLEVAADGEASESGPGAKGENMAHWPAGLRVQQLPHQPLGFRRD